jgi:hypothetical protein
MKSREELRRELRQKIKEKRNPNSAQSIAKSVKDDPQTALMSMGVDDPDILSQAKSIFRDPKQMLRNLTEQLAEETGKEAALREEAKEDECEEEGLPPALF